MAVETSVSESVFIQCAPTGPPEHAAYQHNAVALAEGLAGLGVPVFASSNYWMPSPDDGATLLRHDPDVSAEDCSIVVATSQAFAGDRSGAAPLEAARGRAVRVFIDADDGLRTSGQVPPFSHYDLILRTHYSRGFPYPAQTRPWAFGLTERIMRSAGTPVPVGERGYHLLVTFRVPQDARTLAVDALMQFQPAIPIRQIVDPMTEPPTGGYDLLMWRQTGRRHSPEYYRRLADSFACAAFGGYFVRRWPRDPAATKQKWHRVANAIDRRRPWLSQWDSWRLWEAFAAGCLVVHLDIARFGGRLPVLPEPFRHYIPLDLANPDAALSVLLDRDLSEQIADNGRAWALEHYAPIPTARRFLELVEDVRAG
jgi:hypothetical protein